jgi:hypothetical protein
MLENKKKVIILEAQWAKPLSLTCHFVLRKLYTEHSIDISYQYQLTWPTGISLLLTVVLAGELNLGQWRYFVGLIRNER